MSATKSRSRNYLAGLSTGYARMFATVVTGLWMTPLILRHLDREQFGIFSLTLSVLGWLSLLDFGITAGFRIQAARLSGKPDPDHLNRLASTAFVAQNFVTLLVLVGGCVIAFGFPHFFGVRADLHHQAILVTLLTVAGVAIGIGTQTFSALLIAHQQMHVDNLIGLALIVVRTVLTVVLLHLGWGIYSLAIAHLVAKVVTGTMAVIRAYRVIPNLRLSYRLASWETLRGMAGLGVWFTLGALAAIVIDALDSTVAAKMFSVETVTPLTLTFRFYEMVGGLVWTISETARPMLGQMFGQNKTDAALGTYRHLFAISSRMAVIAALSVWSGNACFIAQWVGPANYAGAAVDFAWAMFVITHIWVMPNRVVLSANLALRSQCLVRLLEGAVNLGLSILLGRIWGLFGIVFATFIAGLLTSMWILPFFTARMFKRPFGRFLWEDASRIILLFVLVAPLAVASRTLALHISGYLGAAVGASLTGLAGLAVFWFFVADKSLKARLPVREILEKRVLSKLRAFTGTPVPKSVQPDSN